MSRFYVHLFGDYPRCVDPVWFGRGAGAGVPPLCGDEVWLLPFRDEPQRAGAPEQGRTDQAGAAAAAARQDLPHLLQVAVTDRKERRDQAKPGGAKPGHEGHSRTLNPDPDEVVAHRPGQCSCCGEALAADLPAEIVSVSEEIELPEVMLLVTQHQQLAVRCPACGTRVVAPVPHAAVGTPFGPHLHADVTGPGRPTTAP